MTNRNRLFQIREIIRKVFFGEHAQFFAVATEALGAAEGGCNPKDGEGCWYGLNLSIIGGRILWNPPNIANTSRGLNRRCAYVTIIITKRK